ncbi:MAG: hypothetical protein ACJ8BF_15380 [Gemmatimonadales bacterium]
MLTRFRGKSGWLVLLAACSAERSPRPVFSPDLVRHDVANASFTLAGLSDAGNVPGESHTTSWADSSKQGGTTFYTRGRVVTTVEVVTDSLWAVQHQVALGLPDGPGALPPDSLCTLGYSGTWIPVVPSRIGPALERTRECQAQAVAVIRRAKLKDTYGQLSVQAAATELESWPWNELCERVKDSTLIAFLIGDDIGVQEWGPAPLATRLAQWDSIGGLVRARCPGAAVVLRATPTQLELRPNWQWLTTAWAQYPGPRPNVGSPEQFFAKQIASAKSQHLGLVVGLNLLNGGCGPAERGWCLPNVPGTTLPGTGDDRYQLSAAELMYYKSVAMANPYVCASLDWSWGPNFRSDFHQRPEIQSAAKALAVIARTRPRTSCIQH